MIAFDEGPEHDRRLQAEAILLRSFFQRVPGKAPTQASFLPVEEMIEFRFLLRTRVRLEQSLFKSLREVLPEISVGNPRSAKRKRCLFPGDDGEDTFDVLELHRAFSDPIIHLPFDDDHPPPPPEDRPEEQQQHKKDNQENKAVTPPTHAPVKGIWFMMTENPQRIKSAESQFDGLVRKGLVSQDEKHGVMGLVKTAMMFVYKGGRTYYYRHPLMHQVLIQTAMKVKGNIPRKRGSETTDVDSLEVALITLALALRGDAITNTLSEIEG